VRFTVSTLLDDDQLLDALHRAADTPVGLCLTGTRTGGIGLAVLSLSDDFSPTRALTTAETAVDAAVSALDLLYRA
jgi:hypothetical protein